MPSRIALVAPNWLGDAVMALPAARAIRASRPGDTLIAVGRGATVPLFSMLPGVDEIARLDSQGGVVGALRWAEDAASLRALRADLAILLPNSFRSAWTARQAGIPERWGYGADLRGRLLTRRVPRLRGRFHQARYYLHLVEQLGLSSADAGGATGQGLALPTLPKIEAPAEAQGRASALLDRLGIADARLVGLAPGAAYGKAKQWPPEFYGQLAVLLHQRLGLVSLVFGAVADAPVAARVSKTAVACLVNGHNGGTAAGARAVVDLAGQTDLPLLVALMARCRAIVSNDSGSMHLAAAAGRPVTAVFGASDERGTAPLACEADGASAHEVLAHPVWCRPCMLRECPIDHRCMRGVPPERVAAAVERQVRD